ncbi:MAG: ABC transporter permease [Gemmatimonadetes bacterium]|nr:ABC transporter permease [Gemmatimonadota bacterium]
MDRLLQDLRFAARSLRRSPAFTLVAVITLALGIGANTAVFSVINGVVLRPLPFPESDRLVNLGWDWAESPIPNITALKFSYWRENTRVFEGITTYRGFSAQGSPDSPDDVVRGINVSHDFFRVAGIQPALGRGFTEDEQLPGGPAVVVIGDEAWRTRFGADPGVIGRPMEINGVPHTVVGVMPPGFRFPQAPDHAGALRPLRLEVNPADGGHNYPAWGRLRPGVTPADVQSDLQRVLASFRENFPAQSGNPRESMTTMSYQEIFVGHLRKMLWILLGAIGFVLLIACANVANLMLARATSRQREISVRLAVGAGRGAIVRQLLTESVLISLLAGSLGVLLAVWGVPALLELSPNPLPRQDEIGIDRRVLGFTLFIATVTGILFGLAAAIPASRPDLAGSLKEGGRSAGVGRGAGRIRTGLVIAEAGLAVVLLAGAGLLISTFGNLRSVDIGMRSADVVTASFPRMPQEMATAEQLASFAVRAVEELERLPGVHSVATSSVIPFLGQYNFPIEFLGTGGEGETAIQVRAVSPGYFGTLEVPVRRGRAFSEIDRRDGAPVVMINESTAERYFGTGDPVGQFVRLGSIGGEMAIPGFEDPAREIVGVVADVREMGVRMPAFNTIYIPQSQVPEMMAAMPNLLVRGSRAAELERALPAALREMDPRLPTPQLRSLEEVVGMSYGQERFIGALLSVFAAIALLLTAVGIYSVISFNARQRTREIGVRMALGASPASVHRNVTGRGMRPVAIGLVLGVAAAAFAVRILDALLFQVEPRDPAVFVLAVTVLSVVALIASYLPARRATRVDPMVALRSE